MRCDEKIVFLQVEKLKKNRVYTQHLTIKYDHQNKKYVGN